MDIVGHIVRSHLQVRLHISQRLAKCVVIALFLTGSPKEVEQLQTTLSLEVQQSNRLA